MTGQLDQFCTVCGHSEFYHEKRDVLTGFDRCACQGLLDANHVYTGDTQHIMANEFSKFHPLMRAPIAYYKGSQTAFDEMALANLGTWVSGEAYADGFDGSFKGALDFDAVAGSRVNLANEGNFDFVAQPYTIAFWARPITGIANQRTIFSKGSAISAANSWGINWRTTLNWRWRVVGATTGTSDFLTVNAAIPLDTWHHVVFVAPAL